MIGQDPIASILGFLIVALFILGLLWLVLHDFNDRRTKHLGKYLDSHRDERNAYYKAERSFYSLEGKGCLTGLVVVPIFLIMFIMVFYTFCK